MLKTTLLLGLLTAMIVVAGGAVGGQEGMTIALLMAGVMNVISYWFSDRIVLAMYGARQVTEHEAPELVGIVRELTQAAGMPMPKVYIIPSESPNAFATGRNPHNAAVAATVGILRMLPRDELRGVMAHELAHVLNRDILISTIAATLAGAITYLAQMAHYAAMFGGRYRDDDDQRGSPLAALLLIILGPIAAMLIQMAISRSREFEADRLGAQICGNPLSLARALARLESGVRMVPMREAGGATAHLFIVNPLSGGGIASLFSTHPPMAERIARLQAMAAGRV